MYTCTGSIINNDSYRVKETLVKRSTLFYVVSLMFALTCAASYRYKGNPTICTLLMLSAILLCIAATFMNQLEKDIRASSFASYAVDAEIKSTVVTLTLSENGKKTKSIVLSVLLKYKYDKKTGKLTISDKAVAVQNLEDSTYQKCTIELVINNAAELVEMLANNGYCISAR